MTETKVFLATIDKDLKIRTLKKYPISKSGSQIHVKSGGDGHFMPQITNTSYLEFPYRAITSFWKTSYRRIYFAMNKATQCVDFESGDVFLPSEEELNKALGATMLAQIGKEKPETPLISYITLGIMIILLLFQMGVFR